VDYLCYSGTLFSSDLVSNVPTQKFALRLVTIVKAVAILDIEACYQQEQLLEKDTSILGFNSII
jgi:hypothetical protein